MASRSISEMVKSDLAEKMKDVEDLKREYPICEFAEEILYARNVILDHYGDLFTKDQATNMAITFMTARKY